MVSNKWWCYSLQREKKTAEVAEGWALLRKGGASRGAHTNQPGYTRKDDKRADLALLAVVVVEVAALHLVPASQLVGWARVQHVRTETSMYCPGAAPQSPKPAHPKRTAQASPALQANVLASCGQLVASLQVVCSISSVGGGVRGYQSKSQCKRIKS